MKTLFVITSARTIGNTNISTGAYFPEIAHAFDEFKRAGISVDFTSPLGGEVPLYGTEAETTDKVSSQWLADTAFMEKLQTTFLPEGLDSAQYSAIYFAGGHGTMFDFPQNQALAGLSARIYEQGGVVGAVCHGPAGLVSVKLSNGNPLVAGKSVAAFTNQEEVAVGLSEQMPFLLESRLIELGASHIKKGLFEENVVVSERLVTGQNPASTKKLAQEMIRLIQQNR